MPAAPLIAAASFSLLLGAIWLFMVFAERRRRVLRERLAGISDAALAGSAVGSRAAPRPQRRRWSFSLLPQPLQARLDAALDATGRRVTLLHLIGVAALAMAVTIVLADRLLQFNVVLTLLLAFAAAGIFPFALVRFAQYRYQKRFLDHFPDALDLIARAVRAGLPPLEALDVAATEIPAPVGTEFKRTLDEVRIGADVGEALERAAARIRVADFRFFVVTLVLQRQTGGALAETLANLSGVIRARKALRRKARALTAEAKTSAVAIGLSPFIAGFAVYWHSHSLMMILFRDPRGRFFLGLAIVFLLCGFVTMWYIIKRALR